MYAVRVTEAEGTAAAKWWYLSTDGTNTYCWTSRFQDAMLFNTIADATVVLLVNPIRIAGSDVKYTFIRTNE